MLLIMNRSHRPGSFRSDFSCLADLADQISELSQLCALRTAILHSVHLKLWNPRQINDLEYSRILTAEFYKTLSRLKLLKSGLGAYRIEPVNPTSRQKWKTEKFELEVHPMTRSFESVCLRELTFGDESENVEVIHLISIVNNTYIPASNPPRNPPP